MELTVRHLSGSLAGQEQHFSTEVVRLGRNPANDVAFDPQQDRVVSGSHAELRFSNGAWSVRDMGSSNGTYVGEEKVTERLVRPGEVIQLGKHGPRLELRYASAEPEIEPTVIVDVQSARDAAVAEGRTVMMSLQAGAGHSVAGSHQHARKKLSKRRALLIALAAVAVVIVGLFLLALAIRTSNLKRNAEAAQNEKVKQADLLKTKIAETSASAAQTQASLQTLIQQQPAAGSPATDTANQQQIADMQRQLQESQRLIEQLTGELQSKNDEVAAAQARRVVVVRPPSYTPPASAPPAESRPAPSTASVAATAATPLTGSGAQPATTPTVSPGLFTGKQLKTRIQVTSLRPEIPPANLPGGIESELVNSFGAALVSTGDFVLGKKTGPSVSITVTNYNSETKSKVNVAGAANSARRVAGVFGQAVPNTPGDVRTMSYDASMSARVRAYDTNGRVVAELEPSSSITDKKSKFSLAGVPFNQVVLSDSPAGDVARKVIGDAVDGMLQRLGSFDWYATVTSQRDDIVNLNVGRSSRIDIGDVFELKTPKKAIARIRVVSLAEDSCEAELVTPTKEKLPGLNVRYLGNETSAPPAVVERSVTIRTKTAAMDGPGGSFRKIKDLKPGAKLKFNFSVGTWAKVSEPKGTSFWVPLTAASIKS